LNLLLRRPLRGAQIKWKAQGFAEEFQQRRWVFGLNR
jgi:hypothetical protein